MMLLQSVLLIVVLNNVVCFEPPWMFMGRPINGFRQTANISLRENNNLLEAKWFDQLLDHFNSSNSIKWKQRFWYNDQYAMPNSPQFLLIGGEAPASSADVTFELYPHVQYAKEVNASLWTLEHRFYGESQPFSNLATQNLQYLTSRQALADIAYFIETQNLALNLTSPKWIVIGGSYAGSLALWFRQFHPELSVGAITSSAPVKPKFAFPEYLEYIEAVINVSTPTCSNNIKTAFQDFVSKMANDDERFILSLTFEFKPDLSSINLTNQTIGFIYSNILSYYQAAVQYNKVNANAFNKNVGIQTLCEISQIIWYGVIDDHNIAYTIQNMTKYLRGSFNGIYIDYSQFVLYLQNSDVNDSQQASTRAWTWQACNEFGYFPTTSGGHSIFPNNVSINFYINLCKDVFGKDIGSTVKNFASTTADYNGTNVLASRGSYDPWGTLALTNSHNPTVITYLINGTGHCGDMEPLSDDDTNSLKQYRIIALQTIKEWLGLGTSRKPHYLRRF